MSIVDKTATFFLVGFLFLVACDNSGKAIMPPIPPEQVVTTFYGLLADGGKLSNREALGMVSESYGPVNPGSFRRWTENYTNKTKIRVLSTTLPKGPNSHDDWVATVNLEVLTPSTFGGDFATTSSINLIRDDKRNRWAIDFLAQSMDEEAFRKASVTAQTYAE